MNGKGRWTAIAVLLLSSVVASAQVSIFKYNDKTIVAVTFDTEVAKQTQSTCACFWLTGGGVDVGRNVYRKVDLAVDFSVVHVANIQPGINLGKVAVLAGPRLTTGKVHATKFFGEALVGFAHGYDGLFPKDAGLTSRANAFSAQIGGGVDIPFKYRISARLPEVDYIFTNFQNFGNNHQNDLRIKAGLSLRF